MGSAKDNQDGLIQLEKQLTPHDTTLNRYRQLIFDS